MGMAERITQPKASTSDAPRDPTVTDTARAEENREAPPSDADPLAFDPGKFSLIEISYEQRQKMLQTKLPRLGPEAFLDTVPPTKGLQAPAAPAAPTASAAPTTLSRDSQPIPMLAKRRPPVGVVIVCLLGALLLLALAIGRSSHRDAEPKPAVLGPSETLTTPTPVVAAPSVPIAPTPTIAEANPEITSAPLATAPSRPAQTAPTKSTAKPQVSVRSSTAPAASKSTPPVLTAPAVTAPPSEPTAPDGFFGKTLKRPPTD